MSQRGGHRLMPEISAQVREIVATSISGGVVTVLQLSHVTGLVPNSIRQFINPGLNRGTTVETGAAMLLAIRSFPGAPDPSAILDRLRQIAASLGLPTLPALPPASPARQLPLPALPAAAPGSSPGAPTVPKKHRAKRQDLLDLRSKVREILLHDGDRLALASRLGTKVAQVERIVKGGTFTPRQTERFLMRLLNAPPTNGLAIDVVREQAAPSGPSAATVERATSLLDRMRREAFEYVMRAAKAATTEPKREGKG